MRIQAIATNSYTIQRNMSDNCQLLWMGASEPDIELDNTGEDVPESGTLC
jgi:hypothetical protein